MSPPGMEQATLDFQSGAFDRSATLTVGRLFSILHYLGIKMTNTHNVECLCHIDDGLVCSWKDL